MNMVEKVARALALSDGKYQHPWEELFPRVQEMFLRDARAAIAAMREPTEEMVCAGRVEVIAGERMRTSWSRAHDIWQAMIDEALK